MALILMASVTVLSCGTCGEQLAIPSDGPRTRDYNDSNPKVETWLHQHRDVCPDRHLVVPPKAEGA